MSRLNKVLNESQRPIKERKNRKIPEYNSNGKVLRIGNEAKKKRLIIFGLVFFWIYLILYFPGLFMKNKNSVSNSYVKNPDTSAIKIFNDYYAKSKDEDFDDDGLTNSVEDSEGTNPWDKDTDKDGVDDYYEIYVSKTNPNSYNDDLLIDIQKKIDSEKGAAVNTPYKCGNVIMWADDYKSKATGGVVETPTGYHFTNFKGYAQFPHTSKIYLYTDDNGFYEKLEYRENEDVWRIDNIHNVIVFNEPIEDVVEYNFFGKKKYVKPNFFHSIMQFILPKKGFLSAKKTTRADVEPPVMNVYTATNNNIVYDKNNGERFRQDTNSLADLQFVRTMIDDNKCVAVSLYDVNDGEFIGIIYGYTEDNRLLVADENTMETIGVIYVDEIGKKTMSKDGSFLLKTYFEWYGLGYSSKSYDRISFFAVADSQDSSYIQPIPVDSISDTEYPTEETTEEIIEETTEEIISAPTDIVE